MLVAGAILLAVFQSKPSPRPQVGEWQVAEVGNLHYGDVSSVLHKAKANSLTFCGLRCNFTVGCTAEEAFRLRALIVADAKIHGYLKDLSSRPLLRMKDRPQS